MNIDKSSLHYRLFSEYGSGDHYGVNLCYYVRRCFFGLIIVAFMITLGVLLSMVILEPLAVLIMYLHTGYFNWGYFVVDGGLLVSGLMYFAVLIAGLIAGIKNGYRWYKDKAEMKRAGAKPGEERPVTSLDVLIAWVKAKHDKVCLMINFVDE